LIDASTVIFIAPIHTHNKQQAINWTQAVENNDILLLKQLEATLHSRPTACMSISMPSVPSVEEYAERMP